IDDTVEVTAHLGDDLSWPGTVVTPTPEELADALAAVDAAAAMPRSELIDWVTSHWPDLAIVRIFPTADQMDLFVPARLGRRPAPGQRLVISGFAGASYPTRGGGTWNNREQTKALVISAGLTPTPAQLAELSKRKNHQDSPWELLIVGNKQIAGGNSGGPVHVV